MTSRVDICNRALDKLGEAAITSLDDDLRPARACARMFDIVRDAELRDHLWNFATARTSLPALSDAPAYGFAAQYQLPGDCLKVVEVHQAESWKVEGRRLLTDSAAPLYIRYIKRAEDPNEYDALFVEALAARLAVELAEPLTQSNSKRQFAQGEYGEAIRRAKRNDAIEGTAEPLAESDWLKARF